MQYMPAVLVAKAREVRDDGSIIEVVVWALSEPLKPSTHCYKYRLYYGAAGVCRVRYDNERCRAWLLTLQRLTTTACPLRVR